MQDLQIKPRFELKTAASLLATPIPDVEWLIQNIWTDKSRGLIAGHPGVGKTWLALDMLLSVCTGQLCFGKYATKQAPVLLIEEEASEINLARRIHCMAKARGITESQLGSFFHLTRQFVKIPQDMKELFHLVNDEGIKLVVFDSLRRVHNAKENSSDEMQPVLDSFARLQAMCNCSIVLIHHLSKGNRESDDKPVFERMRGSGDLWAWRDCIIGAEGEDESDHVKCTFQFRDAEAQEPIIIKRLTDKFTGAIRLEAIDNSESEAFIERSTAIVSFIKAKFSVATREMVFKEIKGKKSDFVKTWRILEKKGVIAKNGDGWEVSDVPF